MSTASLESPRLDFASSPVNLELTPERKIELYRQMVRIRRFELASPSLEQIFIDAVRHSDA